MRSIKGEAVKADNMDGLLLNEAAEVYFERLTDESKEVLIKASEKLISYFSRLYGRGYPQDDLRQAGLLGLLKAMKRYNPDRGASFTTYAATCIIGEIKHYVRGEEAYYKPRSVETLQRKLEDMIIKSLDGDGELPSRKRLAQAVNIRDEGVDEVLRAGLVPLDDLRLEAVATREPESFKLVLEDRIMLETALKKLSDLQQKVIYLLFYNDMTQEQASKKLGVHQRKVSRLKEKSLIEMKKHMDE